MSSKTVESNTPRPSASLILVNARNEVLLVQRNPNARSFGNMHVFPGGNLDSTQDTCHEDTAIRETFEETGILLADSTTGTRLDDTLLGEARKEIHSGKLSFPEFLQKNGLVMRRDLFPFTQWITPKTIPRAVSHFLADSRFHTYFYVAFLDDTPASTQGENRLPTPDGGLEVISTSLRRPSAFMDSFSRGEIALMPPQFYLLTTLVEVLSDSSTRPREGTERMKLLSRGAFGRMQINPAVFPHETDPTKSYFVYEGDEIRGGPKGRRHRSHIQFGEKRNIRSIQLQRNFDIFSDDLPGDSWSREAKL